MRDVVREKQREVHDMHQDLEETGVSTQESDLVNKKFLSFHSF